MSLAIWIRPAKPKFNSSVPSQNYSAQRQVSPATEPPPPTLWQLLFFICFVLLAVSLQPIIEFINLHILMLLDSCMEPRFVDFSDQLQVAGDGERRNC
jgi:hypothetical protein